MRGCCAGSLLLVPLNVLGLPVVVEIVFHFRVSGILCVGVLHNILLYQGEVKESLPCVQI